MKMQESDLIPYRAHASIASGKTLVFAPHPDDEVLGCGGAIIRHVRQGDAVRVVIVTNGDIPVCDIQDSAQYAERRIRESLRAAGILNYGEPLFLGYPDRGLQPDEELIERLLQIIEDCKPLNIYLPAETEIHPDHRAINAAVCAAAKRYAPDVALVFYEIGSPLQPNFLHDITDLQPVLEEAMDCFSSQAAAQDYKRHITALHVYRTYTLGRHVKFAEAYAIIRSAKLKAGDVIWQQTPGFKRQAEEPGRSDEALPLVSVIVRTMNRPELVEALQSIAEQTYPSLEVIVVDAGGQNCLNLGQHCGEFPLRLVSKNKSLNRPQAANAGLEAVRGKYFGFLDEDDLLLPGHFSHLVRAFSFGIAPAVYDIIEQVDKTMACECLYAKKFDYMSLLWGNYIPNMAVLFDAAILRKGCAFDTGFHCYEDWDFLLQAARLGDFVFVPEKGGIYRNLGNSGIQDDPHTISQYRKKLYLKWVPNIPDGKLLSLAHNRCDFPAGTRPLVPEGEQAEPDTLTCRSERPGRLCSILGMPLRILKKIYQLTMDRGLIKRSGLFDAQYYLHHNPDVEAAGMDPAKHYLLFGAFEGRNPSESFDTLLYRYQNPEVVKLGINPLIHYLKCSRRSG
jgi:LmbE family N-acetylglucosaminyl deacetylase